MIELIQFLEKIGYEDADQNFLFLQHLINDQVCEGMCVQERNHIRHLIIKNNIK